MSNSFTPVVHQPTRTTANTHDNLLERICLFAAVFEQRRTTTTVGIRLHTAEVAGSSPASPTQKSTTLHVKRGTHEAGRMLFRPFLRQFYANPPEQRNASTKSATDESVDFTRAARSEEERVDQKCNNHYITLVPIIGSGSLGQERKQ